MLFFPISLFAFCWWLWFFADWGYQELRPFRFCDWTVFQAEERSNIGITMKSQSTRFDKSQVPLPKAYHHVAMAIDVIIYNLCQSHTSKEKWHLRHRHHGIQKWTSYWNGKTKHRFFSEHHVQALSLHPLGSPGAKCCQYLPVNSII